ncbi:MAG: hypothetical protein DRJ50_01910, partial [Actinobacteria bacterium]
MADSIRARSFCIDASANRGDVAFGAITSSWDTVDRLGALHDGHTKRPHEHARARTFQIPSILTPMSPTATAPLILPKANEACWCGSGRKYK